MRDIENCKVELVDIFKYVGKIINKRNGKSGELKQGIQE